MAMLFITFLCLLLEVATLDALPTRPPPNLDGAFAVPLNVSLYSYSSDQLIRGDPDGSVTANGHYRGITIAVLHDLCIIVISIQIYSLADLNARFALQVTHYQTYAEIAFRSIVDHTRFLVFTDQGIRLEAPSNGNHIFRADRSVTFPEERNNGRSFYQLNSDSRCFIAFRPDGTQPPAADLCTNPTEFERLFGIEYRLDIV